MTILMQVKKNYWGREKEKIVDYNGNQCKKKLNIQSLIKYVIKKKSLNNNY